MTLFLLYRLLFIAYAEDEEFLPRRRNGRYDRHSLKQKARYLHEFVQEDRFHRIELINRIAYLICLRLNRLVYWCREQSYSHRHLRILTLSPSPVVGRLNHLVLADPWFENQSV